MKRPRRPRLTPPQIVLLGFLGAIAVGTVLLVLPISHAPGIRLGWLDALFTATSAVCVTGLIVVDTGSDLSRFGQVVVLLLIKSGGLGILSVGALIAFTTGRRLGVVARLGLQAQTNRLQMGGVVRFVRNLLIFTTSAELLGALALWPAMAREAGRAEGAWLALFHAISAWNNAGFSLFADSLVRFAADPWVVAVVPLLFVAGGLGLVVFVDVVSAVRAHWVRRGTPGAGRARVPWSLHTRLALVATGILVLVGAGGIAVLEWSNPATLGALDPAARPLAAAFQGLTPRTAGFHVLEPADLTPAGQVLTMALMFIGANPSSTAGGVKTTTVAVLLLAAWAAVRGRGSAIAFGRGISGAMLARAAAVVTLALGIVTLAIFALAVSEAGVPLPVLAFEAFSAFGTVGLSMGVTPDLSAAGRLVIVALMFLGRVGLLTVGLALAAAPPERPLRYPNEDVIIG
ncbi:MAG: potassium transporter KtrB [Trueperaceae bacterium]|nr:potassium transporter KtrB [Trueperaceae bacterium]